MDALDLHSNEQSFCKSSGRVCLRHADADAALAELIGAALERAGLGALLERQLSSCAALPALGPDDYWLQLVSAATPFAIWERAESTVAPMLVLLRADDAPIPGAATSMAALIFDFSPAQREKSLEKLVGFFRREAEPALDGIQSRGQEERSPLHTATCRQLRLVAERCVDKRALLRFLFDVELPPEALGSGPVKAQLTSLLHLLAGRGALEQFADWLDEECPSCVRAELDRLSTQPHFGLPSGPRSQPAARAPAAGRSLVFISYHPSDENIQQRIRIHLQPYAGRSQDRLASWDVSRLEPEPGGLQALLDRTLIAVLLISADYLASTDIQQGQLQVLLDAAQRDDVLIFPIAVKPCLVREELGRYQMVTPPGRTLADLRTADRERVYQRLLTEILAVAAPGETPPGAQSV